MNKPRGKNVPISAFSDELFKADLHQITGRSRWSLLSVMLKVCLKNEAIMPAASSVCGALMVSVFVFFGP